MFSPAMMGWVRMVVGMPAQVQETRTNGGWPGKETAWPRNGGDGGVAADYIL